VGRVPGDEIVLLILVGVGLVDVDDLLLEFLASFLLFLHLQAAFHLPVGLGMVVELLVGIVVLLLEDLAPQRRRGRLGVDWVCNPPPVVQEHYPVVGVAHHAARGRHHHLRLLVFLDGSQRSQPPAEQALLPHAAVDFLPKIVHAGPCTDAELVALGTELGLLLLSGLGELLLGKRGFWVLLGGFVFLGEDRGHEGDDIALVVFLAQDLLVLEGLGGGRLQLRLGQLVLDLVYVEDEGLVGATDHARREGAVEGNFHNKINN